MALKAWKGITMTTTQTHLMTTVRALVASSEHILFQLDLLEQTINQDEDRVNTLEEQVMELTGDIDTSRSRASSFQLNFEIEEKWRMELQSRNVEQAAEITTLAKKLETSSKRHRAIVAQLKGVEADTGPKRRGRPAAVKTEEVGE